MTSAMHPLNFIDWVFILAVALCIGSFVNVVIHRLPVRLRASDVIRSPSCCPKCHERIRWRDNLPLIGWLLCQGRCRDCHQIISPRYPIIEGLSGATAVFAIHHFGFNAAGLSAALLGFWLLALSAIDMDTRLLPDFLTLSGLWLGLLLAVHGVHIQASEAIMGAALGYALLAGLNAAYRGLRGHDGMGGGDFKLFGMLGAWLGPSALPAILLIAAGGGSLWALASAIAKREKTACSIAFGPWLALAGWVTLIWGHEWTGY